MRVKTFNLLGLIFLFFASVAFTSRAPIAPTFDGHVHLLAGDLEASVQHLERFIREKNLSQAFILSNAFEVPRPPQSSSQDSRVSQNAFVGAALRRVSRPLIGLCGYRPTWPDATQVLSSCFENETMKGLKMHESGDEFFLQSPQVRENVRTVFRELNSRIKFVLIHMALKTVTKYGPTNESSTGENLRHDEREIDTLIRLAIEFPSIQFVLAHSLHSASLVHYTSQARRGLEVRHRDVLTQQNRNSIDNLWLETSAALDQINGQPSPHAEFLAAWRDFGLEKVVFGSDQMVGGSVDKIARNNFESYDMRLNDMQLPPEILQQIFQRNWLALMATN